MAYEAILNFILFYKFYELKQKTNKKDNCDNDCFDRIFIYDSDKWYIIDILKRIYCKLFGELQMIFCVYVGFHQDVFRW